MTTATKLTGTREQSAQIARQPFESSALVEFFGTKKAAKYFACNLGEALQEADKSISRGESEDTAFEMMFWDGRLFLGSDEMYDSFWSIDGIGFNGDYDPGVIAESMAYDENLDATIYLGRTNYDRDRRWAIIRYEWKENEYAWSGWWLE